MRGEIFITFTILLLVIQVRANIKPDCRDGGGRLVCLHACAWRSVPDKWCPQGKHCCLLKPRNNLYHSIKDNTVTSEYQPVSSSDRRVPFFAWLPPYRNNSRNSWFPLDNSKMSLPLSQFPWTRPEKDEPAFVGGIKYLPNKSMTSSTVGGTYDSPSSTLVHGVSSTDVTLGTTTNSPKNTEGVHFPGRTPKVILNPAEYIKPRMKPVKKSIQNLRKSAEYCEKYTKIAMRSIHAMPLLPYVYPYTIEVENCGPSFTPLIVGGKPVDQGEFPHMAALGYKKGGESLDYLCGGSLISEKYVLTAAHCSKTRWGPPVRVHLGASELYSENATTVGVDSIIVHPEYSPPACYHDIALVKLAGTLTFSLELRPACLPSVKTQAQIPGAITLATGWGKLGFGRESSLNLMKVSLKVIDNYRCREFYRSDRKTPSLRLGITPSMMCAAGYKAVYHDTCQGDSGGPLQSLKEGSKCMMEIVGITSFGKSCGTGIPAVYTRVASYLDWIENIVWP